MLSASGILTFPLAAQSVSSSDETTKNPIERIMEGSEGRIVIEIPDDILKHLLTDPTSRRQNGQAPLRPGINRMAGFRIQVFSDGRHQSTLEARAKARGSAIAARFPKYRGQVYTHSSAPNWYTRVGNFRTQAEASAALDELKRAFPSFASEMRVVKSNVIIIK